MCTKVNKLVTVHVYLCFSTIISKQGIARWGTTVQYTVLHYRPFLDLDVGGGGGGIGPEGGGNALLSSPMYAHMNY
jgi:hypothetical protein